MIVGVVVVVVVIAVDAGTDGMEESGSWVLDIHFHYCQRQPISLATFVINKCLTFLLREG